MMNFGNASNVATSIGKAPIGVEFALLLKRRRNLEKS